ARLDRRRGNAGLHRPAAVVAGAGLFLRGGGYSRLFAVAAAAVDAGGEPGTRSAVVGLSRESKLLVRVRTGLSVQRGRPEAGLSTKGETIASRPRRRQTPILEAAGEFRAGPEVDWAAGRRGGRTLRGRFNYQGLA